MKKIFRDKSGKRNWRKALGVSAIIALILFALALVGARIWYNQNLKAVSEESRVISVVIPLNTTPDKIADILEQSGVIRSSLAFTIYIRNHEYSELLKAGTYDLDTNMSVEKIVSVIVNGEEASELFTIPPGMRLDQIRAKFLKAGFSETEVDAALEPTQYENYPALISKPKGASLEGYLYPESFHRTSSTTVKEIINLSLGEMAERLTPDNIEAFSRQGLTPHEAIIIASIIEEEVRLPEDRKVVAQIFLKRYKEGIQLGSDVTYEYASAITGEPAYPGLDHPYNTRLYTGLPPGPIANFDETALDAVANPASTDYLFFLSGDDDKTYYGKTLEEHDRNIVEHCQVKCK